MHSLDTMLRIFVWEIVQTSQIFADTVTHICSSCNMGMSTYILGKSQVPML